MHVYDNIYEHMTEEPPKPRHYKTRLPDAAKSLEPDQFIDVDAPTAACVVQYGRRQEWIMARRTGDGFVRVWRIS